MLAQKNTRKPLPAAIAHMNELLDEALEETFPASDPIAINVEVSSPQPEIATTPWFRTSLKGTRSAPSTQ
jgi:hypothetical protein